MPLGPFGFFDRDRACEELSRTGGQLVKLDAVVDFELFRAEIERALTSPDGSGGGRPP